jgi:ribose transport system substrate-binding protein
MRKISFLICLLFWASLLSAQNREILAEYRIGFIGQDIENPIYEAAYKGAQSAARELEENYSITIDIAMSTPMLTQGETQTTALNKLRTETLDGLIISPEDSKELIGSIERVLAIEESVVFFEKQHPDASPLVAALADEVEAGRMAGREILKHLPTGGRVAILTRANPTAEYRQRMQGLREVLGFRRIERVVHCEPNYRASIEAIEAAEAEDRNGLIRAWVFLDDWPLRGMPALPWKAGERPLVAIQSSPSAFLYMDRGYLSALVVHPYFDWGYTSVKGLVEKLFNNRMPEEKQFYFDPEIVDKRSAGAYQKNWKRWLK